MLAVTGCAGSSSGEPQTTPAQTSAHRSHLAAQVRAYLRENFKGTSWYGDIRKIRSPAPNEIWVTTDLYPDADADYPASSICGAIMGFAPRRLEGIRVAASNGQRIVYASKLLGGTCEP